MKKFWEDFKKFITRGNVVDMAVGVAVATAFTAIVTAFTKGFISPLLALISGDSSLDSMTWMLKPAVVELLEDGTEKIIEPAVEILWGTFVQKIIDFLIIAFVLFLVMRIASAIASRSAKMREKIKNALTDEDEKAALAASEAAAKAEAEAAAKAEAEAAAKAEAEAKLAAEEARKKAEIDLLTEIRDLLKKQ